MERTIIGKWIEVCTVTPIVLGNSFCCSTFGLFFWTHVTETPKEEIIKSMCIVLGN